MVGVGSGVLDGATAVGSESDCPQAIMAVKANRSKIFRRAISHHRKKGMNWIATFDGFGR